MEEEMTTSAQASQMEGKTPEKSFEVCSQSSPTHYQGEKPDCPNCGKAAAPSELWTIMAQVHDVHLLASEENDIRTAANEDFLLSCSTRIEKRLIILGSPFT
jgi:hypothetical protein